MIRATGIALALVAGSAAAGEPMDCYNDEFDPAARYTSIQPDVLRVSDTEIAAMLVRIREHSERAAMLASLDKRKAAND